MSTITTTPASPDYCREVSMAQYFAQQKDYEKALRWSLVPAAEGLPPAIEQRIYALVNAGRIEAAVEFAHIACVKANPVLRASILNNIVFPLLALGTKRGDLSEANAVMHEISSNINMNPQIPKWKGESLRGKSVLLTPAMACIGGLGDSIHFARYIPPLVELGAQVLFQSNPNLSRLFSSIPGVQACGVEDSPNCHFTAGLMELPHILGMAHIPDIRPFSARPFPAHEGPAKIGLHWGASWVNQSFDRTCALAELLPVTQIPDTSFFSLQKGGYSKQLYPPPAGMVVHDVAPSFKDFADTANALMRLDAVVTTDNVVANLSCMLGRPTFVLVPKGGDFRWGDGQSTPWFPTARVYRQDVEGEWTVPIQRLTSDLSNFLQDLRRVNSKNSLPINELEGFANA